MDDLPVGPKDQSNCSLSTLPDALLQNILGRLGLHGLLSMQAASGHFKQLVEHHSIWCHLSEELQPAAPENPQNPQRALPTKAAAAVAPKATACDGVAACKMAETSTVMQQQALATAASVPTVPAVLSAAVPAAALAADSSILRAGSNYSHHHSATCSQSSTSAMVHTTPVAFLSAQRLLKQQHDMFANNGWLNKLYMVAANRTCNTLINARAGHRLVDFAIYPTIGGCWDIMHTAARK